MILKKLLSLFRQGISYFGFLHQMRNHFSFFTIFKSAILLPFELFFSKGRSFFLHGLDIEVTSKCSINCEFCYFKNVKNLPADLSLDILKKTIDQLVPRSIVFLGGGEPFERPDILELISYIKEKKLVCSVVTNGISLSKEKIDSLIALGLDSIFFSLHGPREIHNKVTGTKNAYDQLVKNIKYFTESKKRKTKVIINSTINKDNINHLNDIVNISSELDADVLKFEHLYYIGSDTSGLSGEEVYSKVKSLHSTRKLSVIVKPNLSKKDLYAWYSGMHSYRRKCPYIYRMMYIDYNGNAIPCQYIRNSLGNIKTQNLKEIWNGDNYKSFRMKIDNSMCSECYRCCRI